MSQLLLGWHTFLAALILLVNDWLLKDCCQSVLTGKISDFAGIYLLSLLVAGVVISICNRTGRKNQRKTHVLLALVVLAAAFVLVKTTQTGMNIYLDVNGLIVTAGRQVSALLSRKPLPRFQRSAGVVDQSDLLALVMLPLAYHTAIRRGGFN